MAKKTTETDKTEPIEGELIVTKGFDYSQLKIKHATQVRERADRIRDHLKRTAEGVIGAGKELLDVKELLPHGQFGHWLKAEFGWTERTARHMMAVAEQFGTKTEIISDFQPTALYLLAAPSTPDEARQTAIDRAEAGEKITVAVAKEIVVESKKKDEKPKSPASVSLRGKLVKVLKRIRRRWDPEKMADLAGLLRKFANLVEGKKSQSGKNEKKKGKK